VNWRQVFNNFENTKIGIIGDVMLDRYIMGDVTRVSPEAPVPIVKFRKEFNCIGGAANVALNITALGAKPILFSLIGNDKNGKLFSNELISKGMDMDGIVTTNSRVTTTKQRVIGNNQQLLRIDDEDDSDIDSDTEKILLEKVEEAIVNKKIDALILQDYNKGILTKSVIHKTLDLCNKGGIPTFVDPKLNNFLEYKNVTFFKPNLKELAEGLQVYIDKTSPHMDVEQAEQKLRAQLGNKFTLTTMSEHGMLLLGDKVNSSIAAHTRKISDVSGAGDTVIATLATAFASGTNEIVASELANLAGGIVCESVGVVAIDKDNLLEEAQNNLNDVLR
jgi:D-glycero-beta-D-manno-heptose-7-phosphate kinase